MFDPRKHLPIESYDPNTRNNVRMSYLEKGSYQRGYDFSRRSMGNGKRYFTKTGSLNFIGCSII